MERISKMWRSGLAMLLALCLLISACPVTAFAADDGTAETLNYVSIGDSMANGYGFVGYNQTSNDRNVYNFMTGMGMYGEGAYPLQFEEYLNGLGYDVNHTKLATSAMLAEDLLYLLGGREEFDDGWGGYKDYVGTYSDAKISEHVQKAVADADVITMGIGNAAFGAFLLNRITDALGVFGASLGEDEKVDFEDAIGVLELDAEQRALVMNVYQDLEAKLVEKVPADMAEKYNLKDVVDLMAYTTASYIVNYKLLVEKILEMNSDVEIVLVGLLNTTYGMNVTDENGNVIMPFGDVMDSLFGVLNAYMAGLPALLQAQGIAKEAKLYYAEQPNPLFICQEFEELLENNWVSEDPRIDGTTIRQRNIDAFNGDLGPMIGYAVTGAPLVRINLADIEAYEKIDWALMAQYDVNPWGGYVFSQYNCGNRSPQDVILAVAIYKAIEAAVAKATNTMDISLSGLIKIAGDLSSVFTNLGTPPIDAPESTRQWLLNGLSTEETQGMCKIYGLFKVGNGMSVHPTPAGHDNIAASVIAAYGNRTVKEETKENIKYALGELAGFLEEYGPELADKAYVYLNENGYIDQAEDAIEELVEYLTENAELLGQQMVPVVEAAIEALKAEAEELNNVLKALTDELDAKMVERANAASDEIRAEIDTAIAKIEAAIAAVDAQIAEINKQIVELNKTLEELVAAAEAIAEQVQVIVEDAEELAGSIATLVEVLKNTDELTPEALAQAYEVARAAVLKALETVEVAVDLVNTDIADAVALVEKINAQVVAIHNSTVAALEALKALPEEVYAVVSEAAEGIYGTLEETAALIKADLEKALEELNAVMTAYINEKKAELEAVLAEIETQVNQKVAELKAAAEAQYNALDDETKALINTLIAEAEAEISAIEIDTTELEALIEAKKAELTALYEQAEGELKDEIEAKIAAIEAEIEALEAQVVELNAKVEAINAELKAKVDAANAELQAKIDAINAELEAQVAAVRAEVEAAYAEAVAAAEKAVAELEAELAAKVEELKAAAEAELAKLGGIAGEAAKAVEAVVAQVQEQLVVVNAKVEELIEAVKAAFVRATTSDLVLGRKSVYVALGDGTAAANGYVELVGERVKENFKVKTIHNYAEVGNTVGAEIEKVATREGIADAALITIGFGNVTMLDNAIRNAGKVNYDWAKLVGEELVPYVKEALAAVSSKVAGAGLNENWTARLNSIIEGFAYAAVEYAVELPKLIAEIRAVNTDAVILVVGQYNPMSGVALDVGGATVEVSDYIDGFVKGVAAHGIGYAMITGEAIFVEADDVRTSNLKKTWTEDDLVFDLLLNGFATLYPSESGDLYIANQILEALNITKYVPTNPFIDVKESDYFYEAVMWAVEMGITNGTKDGTTFEPHTGCTRAQIATFLWRAAGCPAPKSDKMPFTDVASGKYYTEAIKWAAEQGITKGTKDGTTFEPNVTCTRAQIVTMLARYLEGTASSKNNPFVDVPAGTYYTDAVLWAVENGITTGTKDGDTFEPNATCTRAHIVTFLFRALDK